MESRDYGKRRPTETEPGNYTSEEKLSRGTVLSDMADLNVSESKLRGLDVVGASAGALMLLGPLAAVAIGMH